MQTYLVSTVNAGPQRAGIVSLTQHTFRLTAANRREALRVIGESKITRNFSDEDRERFDQALANNKLDQAEQILGQYTGTCVTDMIEVPDWSQMERALAAA